LVVIEPGKKASRKSRPPLQLQSTAQKLSRVNEQRNERPRSPAGVVMAQQPALPAPPRQAKASDPAIPQPRHGGNTGTIPQRGMAAERQPRFEPSDDSSRRVSHKRGTHRQN